MSSGYNWGFPQALSIFITTRKEGEVTVVTAAGRITLGAGSMSLRETLLEMTGGEKPKVVLNLSGVLNMDSAGLGEMVSGFTRARSRGGVLKLAAVPKRVDELLRMTGIHRLFEIHRDDTGAVRSFE